MKQIKITIRDESGTVLDQFVSGEDFDLDDVRQGIGIDRLGREIAGALSRIARKEVQP